MDNEQNTFDLDFDIDFDMSDFDLINAMAADLGHTPEQQARILKPADKDVIHNAARHKGNCRARQKYALYP